MNVAIRVDASLKIGTGHVMRCLTLANAIKGNGADVFFICRLHNGNLIKKIESNGFRVLVLSIPKGKDDKSTDHSAWLGATQEEDARETAELLGRTKVDWLIVDHYALSVRWQASLKPNYKKLMVVDDLGDRPHECDLLLDQNYGSTPEKYQSLVPSDCSLLIGADYTLLRPEFSEWRDFSLKRRQSSEVRHLLVSLGGVDADNITSEILLALNFVEINTLENVTVVMGPTAPNLESVKNAADSCKYRVEVKTDVSNMAELMANSDLAIGAAGATTWERCSLGVPTVLYVLADNQRDIAQHVSDYGAAIFILTHNKNALKLAFEHITVPDRLRSISNMASSLVDGRGCLRVLMLMLNNRNAKMESSI